MQRNSHGIRDCDFYTSNNIVPPHATNLAPAPLVAMGQHLHPLLQPTSEREKHHNIIICLFGYGEQSGVAERLFSSYLVLMEGGLADGSRGRTLVDTGHIMDKWVPYSRSTGYLCYRSLESE